MKHVFEMRYGSLYHRGEYLGETLKMVTYRMYTWDGKRSDKTTRVSKGTDVFVMETDNPKEVKDAYAACYDAHQLQVRVCEDALSKARQKRNAESLAAAFGQDWQDKRVREDLQP